MTILILGKGYLGQRFANSWTDAILSDVRIDDATAVARVLDEFRPDAVLNTAGKTGTPNVDWCETHQEATYRSNVIGPLVLAEACRTRQIHLLHLGSGCIFYGPSPDPKGWLETDFANPIAFYSRTKYAADIVLSKLPGVAIARLRMPIDSLPHPRNLITKLAVYKNVIDVINSVTVIDDLVLVCRGLIEQRAEGVFHTVNAGTMRHRDLLALYEKYVDPQHTNMWIDDAALVKQGLATTQRSNCILQSPRLASIGLQMRDIHTALEDTLQKYAVHVQTTRQI